MVHTHPFTVHLEYAPGAVRRTPGERRGRHPHVRSASLGGAGRNERPVTFFAVRIGAFVRCAWARGGLQWEASKTRQEREVQADGWNRTVAAVEEPVCNWRVKKER